MEYKEKKNEEEQDDERAETPKEHEVKEENKAKPKALSIQPDELPVPYLQRLKNKEHEQQFANILERFKTLHINMPLVECLAQMSKYAKFLKELISNKKKLQEFETITLTKECSAIISNKLPLKRKQLGSLTIPCSMGNLSFQKFCVIQVLL